MNQQSVYIETAFNQGPRASSQAIEVGDMPRADFYLGENQEEPITFLRATSSEGKHVLVAGNEDKQLNVEISTDLLSLSSNEFTQVEVYGRTLDIKVCLYGNKLILIYKDSTPSHEERVAA